VDHCLIKWRQESFSAKIWFVDLVIGEMELNTGPPLDQILAYVKNQEKEGKATKQMLETHKQEMSEMNKEINALVPKFDPLIEMVTEIIKDYGQIKQAIRECEVRYQALEKKLRQVNE
jgi:septal ring factor EnvC (AmiA/AmiB activator)